jgi:hypothetical protein
MSRLWRARVASDIAEPSRNDRDKIKLYAGLAAALQHTRRPLPETDVVWSKALALAERLDDSEYELRALWAYRFTVSM